MSVQAISYPLPLAPESLASIVPCSHGEGCPLGVDIPAIAGAILDGDCERAYALARGVNPFASTCGHGCHAPCESACQRRHFGAPVAAAALEMHATSLGPPVIPPHVTSAPCTSSHDVRSVAGLLGFSPAAAVNAPRSGKRVGIIGAGAAGLACAHDLTLLGHSCTIFDVADEPGGVLTGAIPAFRFPLASARTECAAILAMGVNFQERYRVDSGADIHALLAGEFDAIFVAIGASAQRSSIFPEQPDHDRIVDAMHLLTADRPLEGVVVVVGDGDLAIDAARAVLRIATHDGVPGGLVRLVLGTDVRGTPRALAMLEIARAEGIEVREGWRAVRYFPDATGAPIAVEISKRAERSSVILQCDHLITAGARAPATTFEPDLAVNAEGYILADPVTLRTSMRGVWAGGACAFGHRTIAHATADGKRAAWNIHGALTGQPVRAMFTSAWVEVGRWDGSRAAHGRGDAAARATMPPGPPPLDPFTMQPEAAQAAVREASRCFDCTVLPVVNESCTRCGECVRACPEGALTITAQPEPRLRLEQEMCTRCGLCVPSCPEGSISMLRTVWEERLTTIAKASSDVVQMSVGSGAGPLGDDDWRASASEPGS